MAATDSPMLIAPEHPRDPVLSPDSRETLGLSIKEDGRYSLYLDDDEDTVLFSGRSYASMIKSMFKIKA